LAIAINPYLNGDKYCIHPYQLAIFYVFLKNPDTIIKGSINTGTTSVTPLTSFKREPQKSPKEEPTKDMPKRATYIVKNCSTVVLSPTIQYVTKVYIAGIISKKGIYTKFLLRK
jgi:hypothetical protein